MNDEIKQSVRDVEEAMARLNQAFQGYMEELTFLGKDPADVKQVAQKADTLRDSGHLYISWARHYAGISHEEESLEDLDEEEGRISGF